MEAVNLFKKELFEKLELVSTFESMSPLTVEGHSLKSRMLNVVKESKNFHSFKFINNVIRESAKCSTIDTGVAEVHEKLNEVIKENIFKFNIALLSELTNEGLSTSNMQQLMLKEIESLVSESEETVLGKIQNGVLAVYESNGAVKSITSAAKRLISVSEGEVETSEFKIYNPVSYTQIEEGTTFVSVANHTLAMSDTEGIRTSKAPSRVFSVLSRFVENLDYNESLDSFTFESRDLGNIQLNNGKLFKQNADSIFEEVSLSTFAKTTSVILENKGYNNPMERSVNRRITEMADGLIALSQNYKDVTMLDNITVVENKRTNESFMLGVQNSKYYASVLQSSRRPKSIQEFNQISEAIGYITKVSGYDLTTKFNDELVAEASINSEVTLKMKDINDHIESLGKLLSGVNNSITLCEAKSDAHTKYLKKQSEIKGAIVEASNELKELINSTK